MRYYYILLIIFYSYNQASACSCLFTSSFCEYSKEIIENSSGIIFTGELIESVELDGYNYDFGNQIAYKFKVVDFYFNNGVKIGTAPYTNSATHIWILGGSESACYRSFYSGTYLMAAKYSNHFGYSLSICNGDCMSVKEDNTIQGYFEDAGFDNSININDIQNVIDNECILSFEGFKSIIDKNINFHPNPVENILDVTSYLPPGNLSLIIYNLRGEKIAEQDLKEYINRIDFTELPTGIYLLGFSDGVNLYSKKIVKINLK